METFGVVFGMICFCVAVLAQAPSFAGKWQTKTSRTNSTPAIAVNIVESGKVISGLVLLANPDHTQIQLDLLNPEPRGNTLEFRTEDNKGWVCHWALKLAEKKRKGLLTAGCGEMLIEEKVVRQP
jgi:hypothetical protein